MGYLESDKMIVFYKKPSVSRKVSLYLKRMILQISIAKSEKMKGVPFF